MALVLQFLIAVIFLLTLGFPINLAYYSNNSNDNSTNTNTTNSYKYFMENITGGDTITIPMKPGDKDATLF